MIAWLISYFAIFARRLSANFAKVETVIACYRTAYYFGSRDIQHANKRTKHEQQGKTFHDISHNIHTERDIIW